ncbi:MAG: PLP-dependent aminotransferase family protein [Pseudomonadota bacterium]
MTSPESLYRSIAGDLRERIRQGRYAPGQRIPSVRGIAADYGCNKITVQKAFDLLSLEGYLEKRVGSGSYVRYPEHMEIAGEVFDLTTSYLCPAFFPHRQAKEIMSALIDTEGGEAFGAVPVEGEPGLMASLGRHYHLATRQMLIISGAQQGLDLTAKVFATRISESVMFENPTYPGAINLFKPRHFVPMGADGPDMAAFENLISEDIRLFYAMPAVHNPTGISYIPEKMTAVARLAEKHEFTIIEDDYLSEFVDDPTPRFVDLIPARTIYIKSLSQTTAAGIRLGFMIVPESLYDRFRQAKFSSDIGSAGLLQKFFRRFVDTGAYARTIDTMRALTDRRRKRIIERLYDIDGLSIALPQSGYNLWVESNRELPATGMPWASGERFSFDPAMRRRFRLSFMHLEDDTFEKALAYLKTLLERLLAKDA